MTAVEISGPLGRRRVARGVALAAFLGALGAVVPFAGTATAAPVPSSCTLFASPTGSDANDGTTTRPFRNLHRLAAALQPGAVGCLRTGVYPAESGGVTNLTRGGTSTARATLRAAPGNDDVTFQGRLVLQSTAQYLTIAGMKLDGLRPFNSEASSVTVLANGAHFVGNEITAPTRICVAVGEASIGDVSSAVISGLVLDGNRVHHCGDGLSMGATPRPNQEHGIYLQRTLGAVVRHNILDHNFARGLQLYPDADGSIIENNVIDANQTGVNLGGDPAGVLGRSERNLFRNNLITSWSYLAIEPNYTGSATPAAGDTLGNSFEGNCLFDPEGQDAFWSKAGFGYAASNRTIDPQFNNASTGDYRLKTTSPCIGKGLRPDVTNKGVRTITRDAVTLDAYVNPHRMTASVFVRIRLCADSACTSVGPWQNSASTDVVGTTDLTIGRDFTALTPGRRYQYEWVARQALLPATNAAALVRSTIGAFTTQP